MLNGAPTDEQFQCAAQMKRWNRRCRKWALRGSKYCQFHGGRRASDPKVEIEHMPSFYKDKLGPTLTEALEQHLDLDASDQVNLYEELALMRMSAGQAVQLYSAAVEGEANAETQSAAAALMAEALKQVQAMCESAARMRQSDHAIRPDAVALKTFVNLMVRILYAELSEEDAVKVEARMRVDIRMPDETRGTSVAPDAVVREMMKETTGHEDN